MASVDPWLPCFDDTDCDSGLCVIVSVVDGRPSGAWCALADAAGVHVAHTAPPPTLAHRATSARDAASARVGKSHGLPPKASSAPAPVRSRTTTRTAARTTARTTASNRTVLDLVVAAPFLSKFLAAMVTAGTRLEPVDFTTSLTGVHSISSAHLRVRPHGGASYVQMS